MARASLFEDAIDQSLGVNRVQAPKAAFPGLVFGAWYLHEAFV